MGNYLAGKKFGVSPVDKSKQYIAADGGRFIIANDNIEQIHGEVNHSRNGEYEIFHQEHYRGGSRFLFQGFFLTHP